MAMGTSTNEGSEQMATPDHVLPLGDTSWFLWRCFGLRGAGFPMATLQDIVPWSCADRADEALQLEEEVLDAHNRAVALLEQRFASLSTQSEQGERNQYQALLKARRLLEKNRGVSGRNVLVDTELAAAIDKAGDLASRWRQEWTRFHGAYTDAAMQESRKLRDVVKTDRFREAILWQNRQAFHRGLASLLRSIDIQAAPNAKQRQNLMLAAMYLQRYCVKNDTIGFFGPVGWGSFVPEETSIRMQPGQTLLARRATYFEYWGIQVLAEVFARDKRLLPWIAPRCMPFIYLDGTLLYTPSRSPIRLSTPSALLLQSCHHGWTAQDIAAHLLQLAPAHFKSEAEVYLLLESLRRKGLITWTFEVPIQVYPEKILRQQLERVGEIPLRTPLLETMDELEHAREAVESATGDAARLDQAIEQIETTFVKLTGVPPIRRAGEMYAARTLIYEDCQRDVTLELGASLLEALSAPLSQLLISGRWLAHEVARVYQDACYEIYHELVRETGSPVVSAVDLWQKFQVRLADVRKSCYQLVVPLFQERWMHILAVPMEQHIVTYRSQDIQAQVQSSFAVPDAGYDFARYHSPDIMIAAPSVDAIRRNEYQFVLGEIHFASNTLLSASRFIQHPAPDELIKAYECDMPRARLVPVPPAGWPEITTRSHTPHQSLKDYRLLFTAGSLYGDAEKRDVPIGALVVEEVEHRLQLRTCDGTCRFDMIDTFAGMLAQWMPSPFKQLFQGAHIPRIAIDHLVICRESWQWPAHEIAFIHEKDEAKRFMEARRWMQRYSIPRFVFASIPGERKPFYVDFASPIYINIFTKAARRCLQLMPEDRLIKISEMLPDPTQLWLQDANGNHYTSELRIVALETTKTFMGQQSHA
jgi:hypothetical protein